MAKPLRLDEQQGKGGGTVEETSQAGRKASRQVWTAEWRVHEVRAARRGPGRAGRLGTPSTSSGHWVQAWGPGCSAVGQWEGLWWPPPAPARHRAPPPRLPLLRLPSPHSPDGEVAAGWATMRGKRPMQEDTVHCQFHKDEQSGQVVGAFGVFDGWVRCSGAQPASQPVGLAFARGACQEQSM